MPDYADELIERATATTWDECDLCGRAMREGESHLIEEPHADGFYDRLVCEACYAKLRPEEEIE